MTPGSRLGPYEILSLLGAGGMGEVYKGRDTRLDRLVAIKVLSPSLSGSAEARERFEREAQAISQLSHPHICALFDVGSTGEVFYLVMELLDGETLAASIARGPLPMPDVLRIGIAIAEALASAHRHGIVHRDLKPGNVLLTKSGIKLLDFGLAKSVQRSDHTAAATAASLTAPGTWLGTAPYMSPEQIEGRAVEGRSDIFALGAVLYEMATGKRAFAGQSSSAIVAAILHHDPEPLATAVPHVSPALDRLVRICLEKDPDRRWQSAHDVGLQLSAIAATTDHASAPTLPARPRLQWLGWAAAIVATVTAVWALSGQQESASAPGRVELEIGPPHNTRFSADVENVKFAVSPDGGSLAFVATDASRVRRVWMRSLSAVEAKPVTGTEGAVSVFWSPDGHTIAFVADDTLKRLDLTTGAAVAICKVPRGIGVTGTWNQAGDILFASVEGDAIFKVSAGGEPVVAVQPDPARGEVRAAFPSYLPDGRRFLFSLRRRDGTTVLMLGDPGNESRLIAPIESNAQFVGPGTLVFAHEGALVGQPFDPVTAELSGAPSAIAAGVRYFISTGLADFSASPAGAIVYQSHSNLSRIAWVDRAGREMSSVGTAGGYSTVRISPQQRSALVSRAFRATGAYDIWSLDFQRGSETRITLDDRITEFAGVLTGDEHTMYYGLARGGPPNLMRMDLRSGRSEPLLPRNTHLQQAEDVSADGRLLGFSERTGGGNHNLWTVPLDGSAAPVVLRQSQANQEGLRFAPDGRHYIFISNESGRNEVYVAPLRGGAATTVSANGGTQARWSADGRALFYVSSDRRLMTVPVRNGTALEVGTPTTLFAIAGGDWLDFDVSRDGERFLVLISEAVFNTQPLTALQHWNAARP